MRLLDTNICVDFLNGDPAVVEQLRQLQPADVRLCSVVKAELLYGARISSRVAQNLALIETFFAPFVSLGFDDRCAAHYGRVRADLRRTGQTIGANDLMIAAIGLANDLTVVTRNVAEFARVPGLRYEAW